MEEASPAIHNAWSKGADNEEWSDEGLLPPDGADRLIMDSRGVRESIGGGTQDVTKEWVQRMSKMMGKDTEDRGGEALSESEGPVSAGPMSSFGGRKSFARRGMEMSDSDGDRGAGGSLGGKGQRDERKAREEELLRGLDALDSLPEPEEDREERERLMSRFFLCPHVCMGDSTDKHESCNAYGKSGNVGARVLVVVQNLFTYVCRHCFRCCNLLCLSDSHSTYKKE